MLDDAGLGAEVVRRILGVDPKLDRVAAGTTSAWLKPSGSPAAIRIWSTTMSMPVSISVTGCSTWIRQLISMK
jgi:hypothetical protein